MNNLANATMTSAITGAPLEDNIKTGLVSAFISAGAGSAAFEIGEKTANDQIAKALAHAIADCVAGAAGQGKGGCSAGATGAVVGELAAQWYDTPTGSKKPEDVLNFVKVVTAAAAAITGDGSAASVSTAVMTGVNAAQNNYLTHAQVDKVKACLNGTTCSTQAEKDKVIAEAEKTSKVLDDNMDSVCSKNPQSDACRTSIEVAIKYVAMQDAWKYMNADVSRSASDTFDYLYNSNGAQPRFVKYLNTIDKRADFFQASDNYEQNNGSGARWFGGANQVSRAPLTGLGAEGNYSAATFAAGSLLPGNQYDWRDAAGNALINGGFNNFKDLYNGNVTSAKQWDINQLKNEQTLLQPIHDQYLGNSGAFTGIGQYITNTENIISVGNIPFTNSGQGQQGGINILDYKSRVQYGCRLLGYSSKDGCKP